MGSMVLRSQNSSGLLGHEIGGDILMSIFFRQSLTFGRPPSLSSVHIDNQLPHEATKSESGEMEMSCTLVFFLVTAVNANLL